MGVFSRVHAGPAYRWTILVAAVLFCRADPSAAAIDSSAAAIKTDVVELLNGDRITGEIRKVERGKLTLKTDGIGTIAIEWDDVDRVASAASFDVELASGERLFGSLQRSDSRTVVVTTSSGPVQRPLGSIVRISPLGGTLWSRLDGKVDAGFSFTEANVQTQWSFNADVTYRSRRWLSALSADSALTSQEDAARQTRNTLALESQRFLKSRWSALAFAQFQQNEELSLDLRAVIGGGFEHVLVHSNRTVLSALAAAAFTREQYAGAAGDTVAEAVAGLSWDWFTFDGRATNLDASVLSFYAVDRARVRLEANTSFKSDLVGDLYWSINLFESYNGAPPAGQKSNDFGVSAALGWSF